VKIGSAFPHLLEKKYPSVKPAYPLLSVLNLLRMNDISAVPLDEGAASSRAVSGFSCLPKLMKMSPKSYEKFLEGPCEQGSSTLDSFGVEDDLENVLEALKKIGRLA